MKPTIKTIQRVEKKYVLSAKQYQDLTKRILPYLVKDSYYSSHIYNLYLDTDGFELINRSMMKPMYKEKLRIRSYQEILANEHQEVFLEVKKKCSGVVCKRRLSLPYERILEALSSTHIDERGQIAKELSYALAFYRVKPKVFVGYDRLSYQGREDETLRITFDFHIRSRFHDLALCDHPDNQELFEHGEVLMEVKAQQALPLWLVVAMSELKIYPVSFSKVSRIYQNYITGGEANVYKYISRCE